MRVREVIRILERHGFQLVRQTGSHRRFQGTVNGQNRMITVSGVDGDEVPKGTLGAIKRQSGLPGHRFR